MKARVQNKQKKMALIYNVEFSKSRDIATICNDLGITVLELDSTAGAFTVGYLCRYNGYDGDIVDCAIPQEEAVVFSGLSNYEINTVLSKMKDKQATVALKGVVTDTNKCWGLGKLVEELAKEHKELNG